MVCLWFIAISCFWLPLLLCPVTLKLVYSCACLYQETQKMSEFSQLNWAFCLDGSRKFLTNFCTERIFTVWDKHQWIYENMFEIAREKNVCFCFDKWLFSDSLWGNIPSFSEKVISPGALSSHYSAFWVPLSVGQVKYSSKLLNSA